MKSLFLAAGLCLAALPVAASTPIVTDAPPQHHAKAFPNADGPFSAAMIIISEGNLAEFEKPEDQGPHLRRVGKAKTGDHIVVKILFMQPALSNGQVDVTYDLRILRPDGQVYGTVQKTDYKDLPAYQGEARSADGVFNNVMANVMVEFEPEDQRGVYRFDAVVHDNNGDRHIPLSETVTLEP